MERKLTVLKKLICTNFKKILINNYSTNNKKTCGILIIGDEILKGQVLDANTHFLCKGLRKLSISVERVLVIGDDVNLISYEVKGFSEKFDYVLTSGGIGPTHDDVTYEAVAKAFNEPLVYHRELLKLVADFYKTTDKIEAGKKLALIPQSSKLTYGFDKKTQKRTTFPNISVRNVFIFPGIPKFLRLLFNSIADVQFGSSKFQFYTKEIYLNTPEVEIVTILNEIVTEYPHVVFGSYPEVQNSYFKVKITLESLNKDEVEMVYRKLKEKLGQKVIENYDPVPNENSQHKLNIFLKNNTSQVFTVTYGKLKQLLLENKTNYVLWLDGEIKSLVLLHLCHTILVNSEEKIRAIYFGSKSISNDHQELEECILDNFRRYDVEVLKVKELKDLRTILNKKLLIISSPAVKNIPRDKIECNIFNPLEKWSELDVKKIVDNLSLPYCDKLLFMK